MPRLTVDTGPHRGDHAEVRSGQACFVGSADDSDLRLQGSGVAGEHLVIKALKNGGFGVKQIDGDFLLNGKPAQAARLQEGDVLDIGEHRLTFGAAQRHASAAKANAQTAKSTSSQSKEIGGFRLKEILGKGGMGTVYRAEQVSLHREVALKILNKELTKDEVFVSRFVDEARAAARLQHANVVHVFDVSQDGDTYFLSMELMDGGSLEDRLKKGPVPVDEAVGYMIDAAKGLAYAESLGIVHRDIKPDNLMMDKHGTVKIADLGLAMQDGDGASKKIVGTPHFMSPEQVQRQALDHRSDLYSLGCTFYRLVTGHTPFRRSSVKEILRAHLRDEPIPPHKENSAVPGAVSEAILKLLEKSPDNRYASAQQLVEDLKALTAPPSRKGLMIGIGLLAAASVGTAIWLGLRDKEPEQVVVEKIEKDTAARKQAREANAKARFFEIKGQNIDPQTKASRLESMAKEEKYKGTAAADSAVAEATRIREEEQRKNAARKAQQAQIASTVRRLDEDILPKLEALDLRAAKTSLDNTQIPAELRSNPSVQKHLRSLQQKLQAAADTQIASWTTAFRKAEGAKDPRVMASVLDQVSKALDPKTGWPKTLLPADGSLAKLLAEGRSQVNTMRTAQGQEIENLAWRSFNTVAIASLRAAATYDWDSARQGLQAVTADLKDRKAAPAAKQLDEVLQAAQRYQTSYLTAAATGKLTTQLLGAEIVGEVKILGATLSGDSPGFEVQKANEPAKKLRLSKISSIDLDRLFCPVDGADKLDRLAFLLVTALHNKLQSTETYLRQLDPGSDDSGVGTTGTSETSIRIRDLTSQLGKKPEKAWVRYLRSETLAIAALIDGIRALSNRRNDAARTSFEKILRHHPNSLVARRFGTE